MLPELGKALSGTRAATGRSLEDVAAQAAISPSYLRKLELGQVNDPSPRVLRRVGAALAVDYLTLMRLADYLCEADLSPPARGPGTDSLPDDEQRAIKAFTDYLKSRRPTQPADRPRA